MSAAPKLGISRVFDAPRELVFEAWSSAEHMARWLGPKDFTCTSCELDFRPGGAWRACIRSPEGADSWCSGSYRQITRPGKIVFTFRWEEENAMETLVTVTFTSEGGKTRMSFDQAPFSSVESRDSHERGWSECFERLGAYIAKVTT